MTSGTPLYAQKKKAKSESKRVLESSAELKKRQKTTQQEIKETKVKISTNEKSVSQGIADLSRIDADIKVTQKKVSDIALQVTTIDKRINTLTSRIQANEKELKSMRDNYLVAVKKMRLAKGKKSALSFIFSSKNFSQAMRRVRYLREFDAWRERETRKLKIKNEQLKTQYSQLASAKKDKSRTLVQQKNAHETLRNQYARQDALVLQLKQQGEQLRAHLAKKQSEANDLRNSISAAIALEQQREAERRKAEERRKIEERKAEERRIAQQKAEEQRRLEAKRAEATRKKTSEGKTPTKNSSDVAQVSTLPPAKATVAKKRKKDENKQQKVIEKKDKKKEDKNSSGRTYADARRRSPRTTGKIETNSRIESESVSKSQSSTPAKRNTGGGFASMKGSLPRPVAGAFRVTSPFGRHALPELPGVTYDNPGIDAEVSAGATAQAVYGGRVTGVYRLPGYNTVVIVSHGDYYTVYGNLATTAVKNGDNVKQGQSIGKVANSDEGGRPSIHFEVWKNRDKLNPSEWIR